MLKLKIQKSGREDGSQVMETKNKLLGRAHKHKLEPVRMDETVSVLLVSALSGVDVLK